MELLELGWQGQWGGGGPQAAWRPGTAGSHSWASQTLSNAEGEVRTECWSQVGYGPGQKEKEILLFLTVMRILGLV